jgi:parvulin-like peptidyl-prolyl isomerase
MTNALLLHSLVIGAWSLVIRPRKGLCLRASLSIAVIALGLLSPVLSLAQGPFRGPTTGPPNAAQNSFYNGGAPAATFQQPRAERDDGPAEPNDQPVVTGDIFEPGEILAIVGDQYILAGDVLPHVNQVIEAKIPPQELAQIPPEQLAEQKRMLVAQLTGMYVEVKILYLAFLRDISAEKMTEAIKGVSKKVDADFDKALERLRQEVEKMNKDEYEKIRKDQIGRLALLMKEHAVWSPGELDILLRRYGGSIAHEKRYYAESTLGRYSITQKLDRNPVVSHDEMLRYYREHERDYFVPARVKFEIMSTRLDKFPTKRAALEAICAMGNEVFYGSNFGAVAKRSSQGLNAEQGGLNDWTEQGALASKSLDETLFSIEPGKLSQLIEDDRGYHIVRVLERTDPGKLAFEEVQSKIRETIKEKKFSAQYKTVVQKIKNSSTVWTVFDDDPVLSRLAGRSEEQRGRGDAKRR